MVRLQSLLEQLRFVKLELLFGLLLKICKCFNYCARLFQAYGNKIPALKDCYASLLAVLSKHLSPGHAAAENKSIDKAHTLV